MSMSKELQEKYDKIAEECRRFKKQCRILAKRLKDAGCKYNYMHIVRNRDSIAVQLELHKLFYS